MDDASAPAPTAPVGDGLEQIVGKERDFVARLLGQPQRIETDGVSLVWRYLAPNCELELVFYPDLKTEQYHALQYALTDGAGNEPSDSRPCLERIRENGRANG